MDSANTQVAFEIHHLGLRWFTAAFHDLSGEFVLDPDGQGGQLSVVVRMASIDCDSAFWDERLRSPQWFDTAKFPHMVYRSSRIDFQGPTRATVHGDLTLHGITRPVTLAVTDIDCPQTRGDGRGPVSLPGSRAAEEVGLWLGARLLAGWRLRRHHRAGQLRRRDAHAGVPPTAGGAAAVRAGERCGRCAV